MNNTETGNRAGIIDTNGRFEHPIFTPESCKDLAGLIDELPAGSRIGIECSQEMINGSPDDSTKSDREREIEEVVHRCNEKGIEMVCLLDEDLCVKGKKVYEDFKRGFQNPINPGAKKPYYGPKEEVNDNFYHFKFVESPYRILKNVRKGNFDLVVLSRETLIDIRGIDIEEISSNKEIRLVQYDFNNYPDEIDNSYGYKPGDKLKITLRFLGNL